MFSFVLSLSAVSGTCINSSPSQSLIYCLKRLHQIMEGRIHYVQDFKFPRLFFSFSLTHQKLTSINKSQDEQTWVSHRDSDLAKIQPYDCNSKKTQPVDGHLTANRKLAIMCPSCSAKTQAPSTNGTSLSKKASS